MKKTADPKEKANIENMIKELEKEVDKIAKIEIDATIKEEVAKSQGQVTPAPSTTPDKADSSKPPAKEGEKLVKKKFTTLSVA